MVQVASSAGIGIEVVGDVEPKTTVDPGRSPVLRQVVFERGEAVLDLADAAQAAARAAMMADRGVESDFFDDLAHLLYERADGHRRLADQLRKVPPTPRP